MEKITKEMKIVDVIRKYPETVEVFLKQGFHCLGCAASAFENLEQGARAHGINVNELIKELNKSVEKK